MKYSVAVISMLAAVVAAKPHILNTVFDVREGKPFQIEYDGCDTTCTIEFQTGPANGLKDVKTLSTDASGSSTTVTVDGVVSGTYNFKITDNATGEFNYSLQFAYVGTATATATVTTAESTMSSVMSSTMSGSTMTSTVESTMTMTSTMTDSTMTSEMSTATSATKTSTDDASSTSAAASSTNSVPADDSSAKRLSSPLALVACAVAALAYIN